MMIMGKNMATTGATAAAVAVVAVLLACTTILVQIGEAVNFGSLSPFHRQAECSSKAPKLNRLVGITAEFYNTFLEPLAEICAKNDDEKISGLFMSKKRPFCGNVKELKELFIQMDGLEHKIFLGKKGKAKAIGTISDKMHKLVHADLKQSYLDYEWLLGDKDRYSIEDKVRKIADKVTEHLEFRKTIEEFGKLKHKTQAEKNTAFTLAVYKMFVIGDKVYERTLTEHSEYRKSCKELEKELKEKTPAADSQNRADKLLLIHKKIYEDKLKWTYYQFAVNSLAHGLLLLDYSKSYENVQIQQERGILQIAHGWPAYMAENGFFD